MSSGLTVVYTCEEPPGSYKKSIFLAGPSPTKNREPSWRTEALELLRRAGYDGMVFVPESRPDVQGNTRFERDYLEVVSWEDRCLHLADVILFWVPRDIMTRPGLTTNVEWGAWYNSGKAVFGAPENAAKIRYLRHYAERTDVPAATTLGETVANALQLLTPGSSRNDGEREVPLLIWQTPEFQQWYGALRVAGNTLVHARVAWMRRAGSGRRKPFFWALEVDIYVKSEDRHKTNEIVLSRPDIAAAVLYGRGRSPDDIPVVLVREFRSAVSNSTGYVREIPGGSSFGPVQSQVLLIADEVREETGLDLASGRFQAHESRQLFATMSIHRAHLFSAELTDEEVEQLRRQEQEGVAHGVAHDTERTYVEVRTLGQIRRQRLVDWSVLGMITQVLMPES